MSKVQVQVKEFGVTYREKITDPKPNKTRNLIVAMFYVGLKS
jgi:hypothetical protein